MPVIINDFEIQVEPPNDQPPAGEVARERPPAPALRPEDVERIVRHFQQRAARLIAD